MSDKLKWWNIPEFMEVYGEASDIVEGWRKDGQTIYPAPGHVGSAFILTDPADIKVVIIGQDPYYNTDYKGTPHAHGLAFSTQSRVSIPPSLKNILREVSMEHDPHITKPTRPGDLTDWAIQGVFLLNASLSVEAGKPNSHEGVWDKVIKKVIQVISNSHPVVFMLWGNNALQVWPWIANRDKHLILEAAHPSPHSAHRGFFGCDHFKLANRWFEHRKEVPIKWL